MADKETNKKYYQRNKKLILYKKKLQRDGQEIPKVEKIVQDEHILIKAGDLVIGKEMSLTEEKCLKNDKNNKF